MPDRPTDHLEQAVPSLHVTTGPPCAGAKIPGNVGSSLASGRLFVIDGSAVVAPSAPVRRLRGPARQAFGLGRPVFLMLGVAAGLVGGHVLDLRAERRRTRPRRRTRRTSPCCPPRGLGVPAHRIPLEARPLTVLRMNHPFLSGALGERRSVRRGPRRIRRARTRERSRRPPSRAAPSPGSSPGRARTAPPHPEGRRRGRTTGGTGSPWSVAAYAVPGRRRAAQRAGRGTRRFARQGPMPGRRVLRRGRPS